jgi:hypothetical protein
MALSRRDTYDHLRTQIVIFSRPIKNDQQFTALHSLSFKMLLIVLLPRWLSAEACAALTPSQMLCKPQTCVFDELVDLNCTVFHSADCDGPRSFLVRGARCRYCYQVANIACGFPRTCTPSMAGEAFGECRSAEACMGPPIFEKKTQCLRTDKLQKTALLLIFFLGVTGADRFYLVIPFPRHLNC